MTEYKVIVGNIGAVYDGDSKKEAIRTYKEYKEKSQSFEGPAGGELVTMLADGEIEYEFFPLEGL